MKRSVWTAAALAAGLALAGPVAAEIQPTGGGARESAPIEVRVYDLGDAADAVNINTLVSMVGSLIGPNVQVFMVSDSTFAVSATAEQQKALERLVAALQERGGTDLFRVEIVAYEVPAEQTPALGATVGRVEKAMVRVLHNVARGRRTQFEARVSQSYIAEWMPVVADNSVGYQPTVKTVNSGLRAIVNISGSGDLPDLDVTGSLSKADVKTVEQPLANGANLTMGLPVVQERSVQARTRIRPGVLTVISITESLGDAGSLVIAAKVDKAQ